LVVPLTETLTPGKGSPSDLAVTTPLILTDCAATVWMKIKGNNIASSSL